MTRPYCEEVGLFFGRYQDDWDVLERKAGSDHWAHRIQRKLAFSVAAKIGSTRRGVRFGAAYKTQPVRNRPSG